MSHSRASVIYLPWHRALETTSLFLTMDALTRFLTDNEMSANPSQTFDKITNLLPHNPHNPLLWLNRARLIMKMGYPDQANIDATRAISFVCPETTDALCSCLTASSDTAFQNMRDIAEGFYTWAQTLMAAPGVCQHFKMALKGLEIARSTNHDIAFQKKVKQLEECVKSNYRLVLESEHKNVSKHGSFQSSNGPVHYFDRTLKIIHRPGMHDGRYPWDKTNEKRDFAAKTEEGLQMITKEYSKVIENLKAFKIEVKSLPTNVQSITSGENGEKPKITDLQFGIFSKHRIGANKIVLCNGFGKQSPEKDGWVDCLQVQNAISWINHSCNPNCSITFSLSSQAEIKTLRPIQAGEELTILYHGSSISKMCRQVSLYYTYGFVCMCSRCKAEGDENYNFSEFFPEDEAVW
ncbi:hypothetical protein BC937DRAFT_89660 [Endogone sp. FLAS-F59071]|nr:hypothetical protein BC937DRAFT_89660 [Endogone sp. FLAS-F59071]|eukprot:RUS17664.1 hypothetical protein BC937DRAFT_89660 [Endogone sp. FLAS-F59071]